MAAEGRGRILYTVVYDIIAAGVIQKMVVPLTAEPKEVSKLSEQSRDFLSVILAFLLGVTQVSEPSHQTPVSVYAA